MVTASFGQTGGTVQTPCPADLDGGGDVDGFDLALLAENLAWLP